MKTWKKAMSLMVVSSLTALALVGCGSSSKSSDPAPSNNGGGDKAAVASATLDAIKKRDKLVVGVKYDTNLFGLKDPGTGDVQGFDIDIAKELAKTLVGDEKKIELKEVTSKTRIPML